MSNLTMPGRRINVVGTTGSGKTTMAAALADTLGVPHVELDALHWEPGWTEAPVDVMRRRVKEALAGEAWVLDGNYSAVRDISWSRIDTVVWLDYLLPTILWRLLRRSVWRGLRRELLWGKNRERLWVHFFSRDSLLWWAVKTYGRRRRQYTELLARPENAHLIRVHLRSPAEADAWLTAVRQAQKE